MMFLTDVLDGLMFRMDVDAWMDVLDRLMDFQMDGCMHGWMDAWMEPFATAQSSGKRSQHKANRERD